MNESVAVLNQTLFSNIFCCKRNNYSFRFLLNSICIPKQNDNLSTYKRWLALVKLLFKQFCKCMGGINIYYQHPISKLQPKKLPNMSFLTCDGNHKIFQSLEVYFSLKRYFNQDVWFLNFLYITFKHIIQTRP